MTRFQNEHLWHWLLVYFFAWNGNNPKTFSFHNSTLAQAPFRIFISFFSPSLKYNFIQTLRFFVYFQIHKLEIGYGTLYSSHTHTLEYFQAFNLAVDATSSWLRPDYVTKAKSIYQMETVFIIMGECHFIEAITITTFIFSEDRRANRKNKKRCTYQKNLYNEMASHVDCSIQSDA